MSAIKEYLPFLLPILLIQLVLVAVALVDLVKRDHTRGPKWVWVLVILFINFIGPIVYFVVGRED